MAIINVKGFRRILVGEPAPDPNDPKYKELHDRGVAAGRRFADAIGISWLGARLCRYADAHRKAYVGVLLGLMVLFFLVNVWRFAVGMPTGGRATHAVQMQDSLFKHRFDNHHQ